MRLESVCCMVVSLALCAGVARAGTGTIARPIIPIGSLRGQISLTVNFPFTPTQANIDYVMTQMTGASRILCDATEGQLQISQVNMNVGTPGRATADVWWIPRFGRAYATPGNYVSVFPAIGRFGQDFDHMTLFDGFWPWWAPGSTMRSDVIAHEFGHTILGNYDMYDEQLRDGCGFGPLFDGLTNATLPAPLRAGFMLPDGSMPDPEQVHSIMQQVGQRECRRTPTATGVLGNTPFEDDQRWGRYSCTSDCDCNATLPGRTCPGTASRGLPDHTECPEVPPQMSELDIAAEGVPFDPIARADANGVAQCPAPRPGSELVIGGLLNPAVSCGNGIIDFLGGEECEPGSAPMDCATLRPGLGGGAVATCVNCLWDMTMCSGTAGECAPEDAGTPCADVWPPRAGVMGCHPNRSWDRQGCSSNVRHQLPVSLLDPAGQLVGDAISLHEVAVVGVPIGPQMWDFHVALVERDGEYQEDFTLCGNGMIDTGEECEPGDADDCAPDAQNPGTFVGGERVCGDNCLWDYGSCIPNAAIASTCGNGVVNQLEMCDGSAAGFCSDRNPELRGTITCDSCIETRNCELAATREIARYRATFDAVTGAVDNVNGLPPGDPGLLLSLGDDDVHPLPGGFGHVTPSGPFLSAAPALDVRVDFQELSEVIPPAVFQNEWGNDAHWFSVRGRAGADAVTGLDQPQIGQCWDNFWCNHTYNTARERFDGTMQRVFYTDRPEDERSSWLVSEQIMQNRAARVDGAENLPDFSAPVDGTTGDYALPQADNPPALAYCNNAPATTGIAVETQPEEVYILLDRSARMGTVDPGSGAASRLAFAVGQAQGYLLRWANQMNTSTAPATPTPPRVVVAWHTSVGRRAEQLWLDVKVGTRTPSGAVVEGWQLDAPSAPACPGTCNPACCDVNKLINDFLTLAVDPGDLDNNEKRALLLPVGKPLDAPIGDAYEWTTYNNPPVPRTVLFLSDQHSIASGGCSHCPNGLDFILQSTSGRGTQFIYAALGPLPSQEQIADPLSGIPYARWNATAPHQFTFVGDGYPLSDFGFTAQRGEQMSLAPSKHSAYPGGPDVTVDLLVERGASELAIGVSTRHGQQFNAETGGALLEDWTGDFQLFDPNGNLALASGGGETIDNPFFRLGTVAHPASGMWTLVYEAPSSAGSAQHSYLSAYVGNPKVQFFAAPSRRTIDDNTSDFVIQGEAYFDGETVAEGAFVSGSITAHAFEMPLSFTNYDGRYVAVVDPLSLPGGGLYEVRLRVDVEDGASVRRGEGYMTFATEQRRHTVPAFSREVTSTFHLQTTRTGPIAADCDGNGVPNASEPVGDFDGDGVQNQCDLDDDDDGLPDTVDPDPLNPLVPFCGGAAAVNCCDTILDCAGVREAAIYGDGKVKLASGVQVLVADEHALVANAGTIETRIGNENEVGTVLSAAPIILQDDSTVHGDAQSAGDIDNWTGSLVTGAFRENTPTPLPHLDDFVVPFPPSNGDVITQPGGQATVAPSSKGFVKVERDAVVNVSSGIYHFRDLHVEPEGTLRADTSQGPVYVYVADHLHFKGSVVDVHGNVGRVLIAYFGTDTAHLLSPVGATVIAPAGTLNLDASSSPFYGAFIGKEVRAEPNITVIHEAFEYPWYPLALVCSDGVTNGGETDIDCGGALCEPCAEGATCEENADCELGNCVLGTCNVNGVAPTCTDGIHNGDEAAVDCGGGCEACATCNDGSHNGLESSIDCGGFCAICSALPQDVWLEAEWGSLAGSPSFATVADATATTGHALQSTTNSTATPGPNQATYTFTVASGTYAVWVRVRAPDLARDSLWVSVDGGAFIRWNEITGSSTWAWDSLHNSANGNAPVLLNLAGGTHTLTIANRENGVLFDKIYVTALGNTPSGVGGNHCTDGVQNDEEVGVDCGGGCTACQ